MKNSLLPVCLLLGLAACTKSNAAESIAGTYELDKAASLPGFVEMAKKNEPDEAKAKELADKMLGMMTMSIDLKADGSLVANVATMGMPPKDEKGTWKMDGDKVVTTTKKDDGKDEVVEGVLDHDTIKFTHDMGGQKMTMVVKKKMK